jgi:hypothetical protein
MQPRCSIMLLEIGQALVWPSILALIEPRLKVGNGIQPMSPERMPRIYFMRQRLNLPNPATERLGAAALPSTHNEALTPDPGTHQSKPFGLKRQFDIPAHTAHQCEPSGACANGHLRQRPTSANCPSCRTRTSLRSTGIKPIGGCRTGSRPRNLGSHGVSRPSHPGRSLTE